MTAAQRKRLERARKKAIVVCAERFGVCLWCAEVLVDEWARFGDAYGKQNLADLSEEARHAMWNGFAVGMLRGWKTGGHHSHDATWRGN